MIASLVFLPKVQITVKRGGKTPLKYTEKGRRPLQTFQITEQANDMYLFPGAAAIERKIEKEIDELMAAGVQRRPFN